jgi:DNA-binding beta-propeller fold protein YncE
MVKASLRRRALAFGAALSALGLAACAAEDLQPQAEPAPAGATGTGGALLTPWLSLAGGWRLDSASSLQIARPRGGRVNFVQPVGVAVRNDVLLVADAGARVIWKFDRLRDAMAPFATFTGFGPEQGASMVVGNDLSVWVALPADHVVVQYDLRGQVVRRWADSFDAPRPTAVAVPEDRSEVLIADGASARVLVFDPLGRPRSVLGGTRPAMLQSVAAMAFGPRGLYVLDRIAQQVVVLDPRGVPIEVIGEHQLVQPRALAVDASGRVFVSDDLEQKIKVFRGNQLLASVGGMGNGPGRFGRIESMALDGNLLYVADSLNARVQILLVAPASLETPENSR